MLWLNFLHIYQPSNTDAHVIKEATEKSYKRIVRALKEHPQIKFTININGCLVLRWEELGYLDLIADIKALVQKGQIELTGTAAYHPILPLIPEAEATRQIRENENILARNFGQEARPQGFFLPEMAYSPAAARLVAGLGYRWLVLDEMALGGLGRAPYGRIFHDQNSGLDFLARCRKLSNTYVPKTVEKILDKEEGYAGIGILVSATDGELYGLRHEDPSGHLENVLSRPELETKTFSEYIAAHQEHKTPASPPPHSWETSEKELAKGEAFNLWQDKTNTVQKKLWELANLAYETIQANPQDANHHWARWHIKRGLASCSFWWASAKDFRFFSSISWSPDEIERGTNELIRAIRALDSEETREAKIKAEKLYIAVKKLIWQRHWAYYWKKV